MAERTHTCLFCLRDNTEVKLMVAQDAPAACICDMCVKQAMLSILKREIEK